MKKLNVAIVGAGNIGGALLRRMEAMQRQNEENCPFRLVAVCSKTPKKYIQFKGVNYTEHFTDITDSDNVDIVVETVGGSGVAFDIVSQSLERCKHVITNNKTLIATQGRRLLRVALDKKVQLRFEATLLGAVPCIDIVSRNTGNDIKRIYGVLSGSCNYSLMRMRENNETVEQAQKAAIEFGFSDGSSTSASKESLYKLAILQGMAFCNWSDITQAHATGIDAILPVDIRLALKLGTRIKLLGVADCDNIHVAPYLVDEMCLLGRVQGNMEAIVLESTESGSTFIAGECANRNSIVDGLISDILTVCNSKYPVTIKQECGSSSQSAKQRVEEGKGKYYIRLSSEAQQIFSANNDIIICNEIHDKQSNFHGLIVETDKTISELQGILKNCDKNSENSLILGVFE